MFVQMDRFSASPASGTPGPADATADAGNAPGFLTLQQVAGPVAVRLTWHDEAGAPADEIYEVRVAEDGPDAGQAPAFAQLLYFDGPRAPEEVAAGEFAGLHRISPATRGISGLVRVYVLRGGDLGTVVVQLATSVAALEAVAEAVMATELLPGEDPALLPGPDRMELHRVTGYRLPAAAASATGTG
jgi:hypothetical protein